MRELLEIKPEILRTQVVCIEFMRARRAATQSSFGVHELKFISIKGFEALTPSAHYLHVLNRIDSIGCRGGICGPDLIWIFGICFIPLVLTVAVTPDVIDNQCMNPLKGECDTRIPE
jgi:hypothetical protein